MPEAPAAINSPTITDAAVRVGVGMRGKEATAGLRLTAAERGIFERTAELVNAAKGRDALLAIAKGVPESNIVAENASKKEAAAAALSGWEARMAKLTPEARGEVQPQLADLSAYISGGYDNVAATNDTERTQRQERLRQSVKRMVGANKQFREVLGSGSGTLTDEQAADVLRDTLVKDNLLLVLEPVLAKENARLDAAVADSQNGGDLLRATQTAVSNAASRAVADRAYAFLNDYSAKRSTVVSELRAKAKDQIAFAKDKRLTSEHRRWVIFGKAKKLNGRQITSDMHTLMSKGPKALVEKILQDSGVKADERQMLISDTAFMKEEGAKLAGEAMVMYAANGGKFDEGTGKAIAYSSWGPESVTAMMRGNAQAEAAFEQITGEPYRAETFREWMKKPENQKKVGKWLLVAGGTVVGASLVVPASTPVLGGIGAALGKAGSAVSTWFSSWFSAPIHYPPPNPSSVI